MEHGCDIEFTKNDIQQFGSSNIYKKYLKFKENINVEMDKSLKWCPR